jgi:hypothetical protein
MTNHIVQWIQAVQPIVWGFMGLGIVLGIPAAVALQLVPRPHNGPIVLVAALLPNMLCAYLADASVAWPFLGLISWIVTTIAGITFNEIIKRENPPP